MAAGRTTRPGQGGHRGIPGRTEPHWPPCNHKCPSATEVNNKKVAERNLPTEVDHGVVDATRPHYRQRSNNSHYQPEHRVGSHRRPRACRRQIKPLAWPAGLHKKLLAWPASLHKKPLAWPASSHKKAVGEASAGSHRKAGGEAPAGSHRKAVGEAPAGKQTISQPT